MTEPAAFDPETAVTITLAGKLWPVPPLVWRDLKKCRRELLELNARLGDAIDASPVPEGETPMARGLRHMDVMSTVFRELSNEDFDRLVMAPLHAALVAGHPSLSREEFEGWAISESERQSAWLTVRRQSGMFVARAETEEPQPGEGEGEP